jgi:type II secretory pathway component PulF
VLANGLLREAVAVAGRETVMSGSSLAAALRRRPRVPAFVANMVGVGEESGQIETALEEVAAFYQRELDHDLRLLTTLLEPLLMLVIGAVIGFIIFAMLMPIFQIGQALG